MGKAGKKHVPFDAIAYPAHEMVPQPVKMTYCQVELFQP
jgi:hypothetical protein